MSHTTLIRDTNTYKRCIIMKKVYILAVVAALSMISFGAKAQDSFDFLHKGIVFSANIGTSYLFDNPDQVQKIDGIIYSDFRTPSYLLDLEFTLGYRFHPAFTLSGGVGADVTLNTTIANFSIPLFAQVRSEFLDAKVSPFAAFALGYNFMFRDTIVGEDRLDTDASGEYYYSGKSDLSPRGVFSKLQFGVSWKAGQYRMDFAAFATVQDCHRGMLVGQEGEGYVFYSKLVNDKTFHGFYPGRDLFFNRLHGSLGIKLGFIF